MKHTSLNWYKLCPIMTFLALALPLISGIKKPPRGHPFSAKSTGRRSLNDIKVTEV